MPSLTGLNFNPRSPCGERRARRLDKGCRDYFNPRSPCGERPECRKIRRIGGVFQSTLPVRGATSPMRRTSRRRTISIHAPRAGSDPSRIASIVCGSVFQSTLPVRGATNRALWERSGHWEFQSTLPVRGATCFSACDCRAVSFQSTLPVRGATPSRTLREGVRCYFNPRSPCGERRVLALHLLAEL